MIFRLFLYFLCFHLTTCHCDMTGYLRHLEQYCSNMYRSSRHSQISGSQAPQTSEVPQASEAPHAHEKRLSSIIQPLLKSWKRNIIPGETRRHRHNENQRKRQKQKKQQKGLSPEKLGGERHAAASLIKRVLGVLISKRSEHKNTRYRRSVNAGNVYISKHGEPNTRHGRFVTAGNVYRCCSGDCNRREIQTICERMFAA